MGAGSEMLDIRSGGRKGRLHVSGSLLLMLVMTTVAIGLNGAIAGAVSGPTVLGSFDGPFDPGNGPPDATLAAGPARVVELVNSRYAIVDRTGVGSSGPVRDLVGASASTFLSDPQVGWDPTSRRFYFSIFANQGTSSPDEGIAWGFSKTATPNSSADWCRYFSRFTYGSAAFPDRPSLGFSNRYVMFVAERFGIPNEDFQGVDFSWVSKPKKGPTCPAAGQFKSGSQRLLGTVGEQVSSGTAVRQVDPDRNGWIVAQPQNTFSGRLLLYKVAKLGPSASVSAPVAIPVPQYDFPPQAPQAGTTAAGAPAPNLETKGYLTQAYSALDPRLGHVAIWTAHGIAEGAGAAARWYEIDPALGRTDQVGTVSDANLYIFNATVAPDRLVNRGVRKFGSNMVMTFNTSSATTEPAIGIVSKRGGQPQSAISLIKTSPGPNVDFNCFQSTRSACRWGDFSGTSPDPGASRLAGEGQVWVTNQWNLRSTDDSAPDWRTKTALIAP